MFTEARSARLEIAHVFESIDYTPSDASWRKIVMGIKRDLQAKRLRPNVPVPPRRNLPAYLQTMHRETGSWLTAIGSVLHDGSWTSSGGSFRLAEKIGLNLPALCAEIFDSRGTLTFLEIGAGWAGLHPSQADGPPQGIAGLAHHFSQHMQSRVMLHFTNLTRWHNPNSLPEGVFEHAYVTAASLAWLEQNSVAPGSIDIIYSQAAAYFEEDQETFLEAAAHLLKPGGVLIYNHHPDLSDEITNKARARDLSFAKRIVLGNMNGAVSRFDRIWRRSSRPIMQTAEPGAARSR